MHLTADQLKQCNLANLTALWRAMGAQPMPMAGAISAYGNASWPRRFWIETDTPLPTKEALCDFVALLPAECIVPVPDCPFASDLGAVLKKAGFGVSFEQNAMYLTRILHEGR